VQALGFIPSTEKTKETERKEKIKKIYTYNGQNQ
jgi:hypothetical protein